MAKRSTPRETALSVVAEMDALAESWSAKATAALAEIDRLTDSLGELALADPVAAAAAPARMQMSRDTAAVADRAVAAAQAKALVARRAAVRAEAAEVEPLIEAAQTKLTAHQERTAVLLAALIEHAHEDYSPTIPVPYDSIGAEGTRSLKIPIVATLTVALSTLVKQQAILTAVADDIDPREVVFGIAFDLLPPIVRPGHPDCVLPAPGFDVPVDMGAQYRRELVEAEQRLADARGRLAEIEAGPTAAGLGEAQRDVTRREVNVANVRRYVDNAA